MAIKRTDMAEVLRQKRKELRISQEEMADKLGIKRCTYARYETTVVPPASIILKISDIFGTSIDELFNREGGYMARMQQAVSVGDMVSNVNAYNKPDIDLFSVEQLSDDEADLIYKLRSMPKERRDAIKQLIASDPVSD